MLSDQTTGIVLEKEHKSHNLSLLWTGLVRSFFALKLLIKKPSSWVIALFALLKAMYGIKKRHFLLHNTQVNLMQDCYLSVKINSCLIHSLSLSLQKRLDQRSFLCFVPMPTQCILLWDLGMSRTSKKWWHEEKKVEELLWYLICWSTFRGLRSERHFQSCCAVKFIR